jgi:hypothetical protein
VVPELLPAVTQRDRRGFFLASGLAVWAAALGAAGAPDSAARSVRAAPGNYRQVLGTLRAGDQLALDAGEYPRGLPLHGLVGTAAQPIVIQGPAAPERAVFVGRPGSHTVSLLDSAYVIVRDLVLDGRGAAVDAVRAEGHAHWAHHVTLERLTIVNHGASQQNSGISTKCPSWGWVVRDCTIVGAGTGMYFGDSDGSDPFFDSLIEGNRIIDPVGYGIQIKHQHGRPEGAPDAAASTVIRGNRIVKSRVASSPEMARPSLLVGHFPLTGTGAHDRYLVYRNVLIDNPSESLFQGEGNIALYNNLLFNPRGEGMRIQPHNDRPREMAVFNNTIVAAALGVEFSGGEPGFARLFEHNLVFGNPAISSEVAGENVSGEYDKARPAFVRLDADPDRLDLTPRATMPTPRSSVGDQWLDLPGARSDCLGRPRRRAAFGACLRL